MQNIEPIENNEQGLSVRDKLNQMIDNMLSIANVKVENVTGAYTLNSNYGNQYLTLLGNASVNSVTLPSIGLVKRIHATVISDNQTETLSFPSGWNIFGSYDPLKVNKLFIDIANLESGVTVDVVIHNADDTIAPALMTITDITGESNNAILTASINAGDETTTPENLKYKLYGNADSYETPILETGSATNDNNVSINAGVVTISGIDLGMEDTFKITAVDEAGNESNQSAAYTIPEAPPEEPLMADAIFYLNNYFDDTTVDGSNRTLNVINRADNNNNLKRDGVADADLPIYDPVEKTVFFARDKRMILQHDILFDVTQFTIVLVGENQYTDQGNITIGQNVTNTGSSTFFNYRSGGRDLWLYPGKSLQFNAVAGGSANPVDSFLGKQIISFSVDTQNSQTHIDVWAENLQRADTISRDPQVSTIGFINEIVSKLYADNGIDGYKLRAIGVFPSSKTPAQLVDFRNHFLAQYPIPEII